MRGEERVPIGGAAQTTVEVRREGRTAAEVSPVRKLKNDGVPRLCPLGYLPIYTTYTHLHFLTNKL